MPPSDDVEVTEGATNVSETVSPKDSPQGVGKSAKKATPPTKKAPAKAPAKAPPAGGPPEKGPSQPGVRQMARRPSIIGRKLHWDALGSKNIMGTVFQELNQDMLTNEDVATFIDVEAMQRIFASRKDGKRRATIVEIDMSKKIIGASRAQNVAIVLSRLPMPAEEIAVNLDSLSSKGMSRELIERVMEVAPPDDEIASFKTFMAKDGDIMALRDVERKYLPFFKVVKMKEKCRSLLSFMKIPETAAELKKQLDLLYEAGREIRKSNRFRSLLVAVLLWGNFVNYGVGEEERPDEKADEFGRKNRRRGTAGIEIQTFGFTLPSLLKLSEFKTTLDPSITSLHFIVANMIESQPKIELPRMCEELTTIPNAAKISSSALKEYITTINEEVKFLEKEIKSKDAETTYGSGLKSMEQIYSEGIKIATESNKQYASVTSFVGETAAYFGDATAKTRPEAHEEFFKTLNQFLLKFQGCVNDYQSNTKKFKDILVESAHHRGLTYIEDVETGGGGGGGNSTLKAPKTVRKAESKGKVLVKARGADAAAAAAAVAQGLVEEGQLEAILDVTVSQDEGRLLNGAETKSILKHPETSKTTQEGSSEGNFLKVRTMQRRASLGATRENVLLPSAKRVAQIKAPPARIKTSLGADQPPHESANTSSRSTNRRSTASGAMFGLGSSVEPSLRSSNYSLHKSSSHKKIEKPSFHRQPGKGTFEQADIKDYYVTIPTTKEIAENKSNSDSEYIQRESRNYIVHPEKPSEIESDLEENGIYQQMSGRHIQRRNSASNRTGTFRRDAAFKAIEKVLGLLREQDSLLAEATSSDDNASIDSLIDKAVDVYVRTDTRSVYSQTNS